ncbi:unnamed protein product [Citrullus colocynthis]|uniref:Uncharacterized protein n=1 Tax=Citrullus colocynthis TaxID=252529 RepID=A0ABP0XZP1_9ROSI
MPGFQHEEAKALQSFCWLSHWCWNYPNLWSKDFSYVPCNYWIVVCDGAGGVSDEGMDEKGAILILGQVGLLLVLNHVHEDELALESRYS